MTAPQHPALAAAYEAVRSLRTVQAQGPADAATLILGIAGDGTGGPSLIGELASVLAGIAGQDAVGDRLPASAARYVLEAVAYAQMTISQQAGDYLAQALNHLEEPGLLPARSFWVDFGLQEDTEPAPAPKPTTTPVPAPVADPLAKATR